MIRINLLPAERAKAATRRAASASGLPPGQRVTLACSLILVAAGLGILWWWWALGNASARLDGELLAAQRETIRLRSIILQVDNFEKQKQQLQQRVALIEELRKGQGAPVRILDELSKALPDMLWLTELKQDGTGDLSIDGRCVTLTALSDFVGNLERSGQFHKPVEIVDSQVESSAAAGPEMIKFTVKATFGKPEPPAGPVRPVPPVTPVRPVPPVTPAATPR
jgi:type IV pilus assembly protein PilN